MKAALTSAPVLRIFDRKSETEVHTDASKNGFGAVLLQKSTEDGKFHPFHFMSRKTSSQQQNLYNYELEVLAVMKALRKLRTYLLGIKFKIVTDCLAFNQTLKKKEVSPKIWRC